MTTAASAAHRITEYGSTWWMRPVARVPSIELPCPFGEPPLYSRATPVRIVNDANVMMMSGRRSRWISRPFTAPTTTPITMA